MLHHISISAANPRHVAEVLAELMEGQFFEFPVCPGAYIAVAGDDYGTAIEVLPEQAVWIPGLSEAEPKEVEARPQFSAVHAAISVSISRAAIEAIGLREGWLTRYCDRGPFQLMEFWIENNLMLEFLTPEMAKGYLDFAKPDVYADYLQAVTSSVA